MEAARVRQAARAAQGGPGVHRVPTANLHSTPDEREAVQNGEGPGGARGVPGVPVEVDHRHHERGPWELLPEGQKASGEDEIQRLRGRQGRRGAEQAP
jgi:hypothetical protein